ncbi:MAG: hypothetical protein ACOX8U_03770 [Bradymonadia bacterium]|jgi:hypothetical protein
MSQNKLPPHVINMYPEERTKPFDSCFIPKGYLFPETREGLSPYREFPLSEPYYALKQTHPSNSYDFLSDASEEGDFDSTILHISDLDELLLNVQAMGLQYILQIQNCLRDDYVINPPRTWDKLQSLLLNIPVFSEELCQWHYPVSQIGYNISNTDAPTQIDVANNMPQLFGYLPNGDLAIYWEIADALHERYDIDLEPMRTSVDGDLVLMPGIHEIQRAQAPVGSVVDTGVLLMGRQRSQLPALVEYATRILRRRPVVLREASYPYYILKLQVIPCEFGMNRYGEATWGAFGFSCDRLSGYDFRVINNPLARTLPIYSTELGNIVVSVNFLEDLKALCERHGQNLTARSLPILRIP